MASTPFLLHGFMTITTAIAKARIQQTSNGMLPPKPKLVSGIEKLENKHHDELLVFLARRPIHTVCMASFVRDNGVVSPLNRGTFYGYRGKARKLEGVALVGHSTLIESESEAALRAFAELTHNAAPSHLIRGEHQMIDRFWVHYAGLGHKARLTCHEQLFQCQSVPQLAGPQPDLRPATLQQLNQIAEINAEMVLAECGVDPLIKDPKGFVARLSRRIDQGRIWIWQRNNKVIFKTDIFAETPEMMYLEGVFVNPQERGRGVGQRCLTHLSHLLLQRSKSLCLLINEDKPSMQHFYKSAGFQTEGTYETIYFTPRTT